MTAHITAFLETHLLAIAQQGAHNEGKVFCTPIAI